MSIKKFLLLISLILLPVGAFYVFHKKRKAAIIEPIKTEKPIRKALVQMITASGNLKAKEQNIGWKLSRRKSCRYQG